jgi:HJR/Mrr/RecB family endonuclease
MKNVDKKKVSNIYISPLAHETIKSLAALQGVSMQVFIADWLDETQPIIAEMLSALIAIKSGENAHAVFKNFIGKGLRMAGDELMNDDEEENNATDKRKSD